MKGLGAELLNFSPKKMVRVTYTSQPGGVLTSDRLVRYSFVGRTQLEITNDSETYPALRPFSYNQINGI